MCRLFYRHYDPVEVAEYVKVGNTQDTKSPPPHPFIADGVGWRVEMRDAIDFHDQFGGGTVEICDVTAQWDLPA